MWNNIVVWFKCLVGIVDKADDFLEDVDEVVSEVIEEIDAIVEREVKDVKGE